MEFCYKEGPMSKVKRSLLMLKVRKRQETPETQERWEKWENDGEGVAVPALRRRKEPQGSGGRL